MNPPPPLTALSDLDAQLRSAGYAVLDAASLSRLSDVASQQLQAWRRFWDDLPPDAHLRDGGRYRRRRHGSFIVDGTPVAAVPQRAHWQPRGIQRTARRHRALVRAAARTAGDRCRAGRELLAALGALRQRLRGAQRWFVEAHPFRIETGTEGIGRPTPEGAHRDGVDMVAVILVARHNVKGGETRVFDARGPQGLRFTLAEPWSVLLLDDARVIHETTPIQPLDASQPAQRDTLVLTYRAGGFQDARLSYAESMTLAIDFDDVRAGRAAPGGRGASHAGADARAVPTSARGASVFFKCENLQRMGAFKFRGAYNALSQFTPEQRSAGAIAFSSGNHAQAVALSARLLGMPSVIVMPQDAPQSQARRPRAPTSRACRQRGDPLRPLQRRPRGAVPPRRRRARHDADPALRPCACDGRAGHRGAGADRGGGPLDALLVCVGGGGLIAGCAVAARHLLPGIAVLRRRARGRQRHPAQPAARRDRAHRHAAHHRRRRADPAQRPADLSGDPGAGEGCAHRQRCTAGGRRCASSPSA